MNSGSIIVMVISCIVTVAAFCAGKFVFPNLPADVQDKLLTLTEWAAQFVVWAREFKKTETGQQKMAAVVDQLKQIAAERGIEVTEDQLKAIAQTAYEAMKAGEAEAAAERERNGGEEAAYYRIGGRAVAKGGVINIYSNEADVSTKTGESIEDVPDRVTEP